MSTVTVPEDSLRAALVGKAEELAGLRLAHEAVMVADAEQVLRTERELNAAYARKMLADEAGVLPEIESSESMIRVGNEVHHHYPPPVKEPAVVTPPPAPPSIVQPIVQAAKNGMSTWMKTGIAAALLGSGAAVPLAVNALWPKKDSPAGNVSVDVFDPGKWEIIIPDQKDNGE